MMKPMNAMHTEATLTSPTLAEPSRLIRFIRPQTLRKSVTAVLGVTLMLGGVAAMSVDLSEPGFGTDAFLESSAHDAQDLQNAENTMAYVDQWVALGAEANEDKESLAFKEDDYRYALNDTEDPAGEYAVMVADGDADTHAYTNEEAWQKTPNQANRSDNASANATMPSSAPAVSDQQSYLFETGQVMLNPMRKAALKQWLLQKVPKQEGVRIRISGYADTRGSAQGNGLLSEKRADNVKVWIQSQWKAWGWQTPPFIISAGLGQTNQFSAENVNENRRVVISVEALTEDDSRSSAKLENREL